MLFRNRITTIIGMISSIFSMLIISACSTDKSKPALEYMPDMYRSASYETYSDNPVFADKITAQKPVEGTVPRGFMPYPYPNTNEGYEMAANLKNPLVINQHVLDEGKVLYTKFCVYCHAANGDGNGPIVANGKFPAPPPSYTGAVLMNLPEGKMFHSITHGKGMMGAHASQISQEDRWKIVSYITSVFQKRTTVGGTSTAAVDTSKEHLK